MPTLHGFGSETCSVDIANKLSAECINLYCTAILSNKKLAQQLRSKPIIARQLAIMTTCNKAIFAAGTCNENSHVVSCGLVTKEELHYYRQQGAIGVLCGQFIDH